MYYKGGVAAVNSKVVGLAPGTNAESFDVSFIHSRIFDILTFGNFIIISTF
jgi:hypothetical protein